jgi:hypothetical protein
MGGKLMFEFIKSKFRPTHIKMELRNSVYSKGNNSSIEKSVNELKEFYTEEVRALCRQNDLDLIEELIKRKREIIKETEYFREYLLGIIVGLVISEITSLFELPSTINIIRRIFEFLGFLIVFLFTACIIQRLVFYTPKPNLKLDYLEKNIELKLINQILDNKLN